MNFLLDTNVVSELAKNAPSPIVLAWMGTAKKENLWISEVTIAEIRFGIEVNTKPERRRHYRKWLDGDVRRSFVGRIVMITEDMLFRWLVVASAAQKSGQPLPQADSLIAATGLQLGMTIVSRDTSPFVAARVPVFNPWTGERFNGA